MSLLELSADSCPLGENKLRKVLVLGATGMLGNACEKFFLKSSENEVISTSRNKSENAIPFDAKSDSIEDLLGNVNPDWIINCIGIIKPHINESLYTSTQNAIDINSLFPHRISAAIEGSNTKVIQIATDCVYSGQAGLYTEKASHDALDVYGKTKSLGEVHSNAFIHIRASIIGPEQGRSTSLLEWFLGQKPDAEVNGFTDHLWNGVTTHQFAKLAFAITKSGFFTPGVKHVLPKDILTKAELLETFKEVYGRKDITVNHVESSNKVDRTLSTTDLTFSDKLWSLAGYESAPTIQQMIREQFDFNNSHI
jgi:dTDP-4-dehydrorhamnose reductase